ncbi:MAG: DUF4405 domain-containing protein [Peptostreptococcaceae bacterium]|jgi:hypothetical protein|nr:DUF4405 domain-containing protein [Peptostreptococcaceae bacterium]
MNNKKALKIVNILLFVDFLIVFITALFNEVLKPMGLYKQLHALPGFLMVILALTHVYLNKEWIKNNMF